MKKKPYSVKKLLYLGNKNEKNNGSIIVKCYSVDISNIFTIDFHQKIAALNCSVIHRKLLKIYDLFDNEKPLF